MKTLYGWFSMLLFLAVIVQIAFVGVGGFHAAKVIDDKNTISKDSFESWFGLHAGFGYILVLAGLVFALISLGTRDRRRMKVGFGVFGLFVVQVVLAWLAFGVPALGWLHPINALVILAVLGKNAMSERRPAAGLSVPAAAPAA